MDCCVSGIQRIEVQCNTYSTEDDQRFLNYLKTAWTNVRPINAWDYPVDISWVDLPYKASIPVTSCIVDSAAISIMGAIFRNTICPPPPQLLLHRRAALSTNSKGTQSVYSRRNPKSHLYFDMSVVYPSVRCAHRDIMTTIIKPDTWLNIM
jgi:hypothetical protein